MNNTLLINTVINKPSISFLSSNKTEDSELFLESGKDQIGKILPLSLEATKEKSFENITTLIGPGSFTSIRIGLALTKGISVSKNCDIKPITTFEYMIHSTKLESCDYILCVIEAGKKDSYFIQLFSKEKKAITNAYEYNSESIINLLKEYENTKIISNCDIKNIDSAGKNLISIEKFNQEKIDKKSLKLFLKSKKTIKPVELKALYIRPHYATKKT